MKFLVFILISVCAVNGYQRNQKFKEIKSNWQEKVLKHFDYCLNESGVDPILALRFGPHGEYVDDYKLKCFVKCIAYKMDLINEDGTAKRENFLKAVEVDNTVIDEGYLHSCFAIKLSDPCDTAFKISECMHISIGKAVETLHP